MPLAFAPSALQHYLLPIPTTQELRKQFQVISELRAEIRSLQSDNLKLYEKVRYMQSYRENSAQSSLDPLPPSSTGAPSAGELSKYSARYEEAMNPFEAFRGRVRCYSPIGSHLHTLRLSDFNFFFFCVCAGSSAGIFESQPARTRRPRANTRGPGKPPRTQCIHRLCCRTARARHVHAI